MTPDWQSDDGAVQLYCADCLKVLPRLTGIDAVIADPPFSERTHNGHDSVAVGKIGSGNDGMNRVPLGYTPWTHSDVSQVCAHFPPQGWCCILTDHILFREWEDTLIRMGRYVFAPIPIIVKGRSVRLAGDGPCSWTDWMCVSRTKHESKWGTLPGFYEGHPRDIKHKGGKPTGAITSVVRDYSRRNDVVLDFCMGSGTTGIACIRTGRKFIGIEIDPKYFEIARDRIKRELAQGRLPL